MTIPREKGDGDGNSDGDGNGKEKGGRGKEEGEKRGCWFPSAITFVIRVDVRGLVGGFVGVLLGFGRDAEVERGEVIMGG